MTVDNRYGYAAASQAAGLPVATRDPAAASKAAPGRPVSGRAAAAAPASSGAAPASRLAQAMAARSTAAAPAPELSQLAQRPPRGELVDLPAGLGPAWLELLPSGQRTRIEGEVLAELTEHGLELNAFNANTVMVSKIARTLAYSVRCADDRDQPFGTLADWQAMDDDLLAACNAVYTDVRERLDPFASSAMTDEAFDEIAEALQKKSATALRSFGVVMLCNFMLCMDSRRSTSATAASPTGPSSRSSTAMTMEEDPIELEGEDPTDDEPAPAPPA